MRIQVVQMESSEGGKLLNESNKVEKRSQDPR